MKNRLNLDERETVKHLLYAAGFTTDNSSDEASSTPKRRKCKFCSSVCPIPKFSTSAESFDEFRRKKEPTLNENVLKIMKCVQDYRQLKRRMDEIEMMKTFVDSDSRIRYNTSFTETGRIQMEDPSLLTMSNDCEINGILISPRTCIGVVGNSKILLSMDFKQIEQRVIAHVSNDKLLCQLLNDDQNDFFEVTAKKILGSKDKRKTIKAMVYGLNYGMGTKSLAIRLKTSEKEAEGIKNAYFELFENMAEYRESMKKTEEVHSLLGRKRKIHKNQFCRAIAVSIQSGAADIVRITTLAAEHTMLSGGGSDISSVKLCLQIHDELIFELDRSELEKFSRRLERNIEKALLKYFEPKLRLKFPIRFQVGKNWGQLKPM